MRVMSMKGGASGGTIASMMNMAEEVFRDERVRESMSNPFALNPQGDLPLLGGVVGLHRRKHVHSKVCRQLVLAPGLPGGVRLDHLQQ
jgi:hypothetical protein